MHDVHSVSDHSQVFSGHVTSKLLESSRVFCWGIALMIFFTKDGAAFLAMAIMVLYVLGSKRSVRFLCEISPHVYHKGIVAH